MSSGRYAPLATSSNDSVDHQYREDAFASRGFGADPASRQMSWGHAQHLHHQHQRELGLVEKGKRQYWTGKQYMREKMGKEQDEHQMADDAELDSQMERTRHIQKQCYALCRALLQYQEVVQQLTSRQVALSALLRAYAESEADGPCSEMMSRLGTVMQDEAVQWLELDVPLTRFFSEVETFRGRALVDTLINVNQVTQERRKFRGALLWMADASRNLDPDTRKHLTKFRQAQQMARESRQEFENKKGTVCEKVDLLAASFCNLLSHAMTPYQKALGRQWSSSAAQYCKLLEWSRETLRHQYRLQRDVLRDQERLKVVPGDLLGSTGASSEADTATSGNPTSESWSEGRMLTVLGEASPAAVQPKTIEEAKEALEEDENDLEGKSNTARQGIPATSAQSSASTGDAMASESVASRDQDSTGGTDPKATTSVDTKQYPDYSWLELMTEGSAASAMADFSTDMQSQVQKTLLDLARTSTSAEHTAHATAEAHGESSAAGVDLLAYEMSGADQSLHGTSGMRQLTNDEAQLDKVVPISSVLRHRQEMDMQAETRLEKELAQMVDDFSSLSAPPGAAASQPVAGLQSLPSDLFSSLAPGGSAAGTLPSDLLDVGGDVTSMMNVFNIVPSMAAPQPPLAATSASSTASQLAGLSASAQSGVAPGSHPTSETQGKGSHAASGGASNTAAPGQHNSGGRATSQTGATRQKWFDLFSELDPLANPDDLHLGDDAADGQAADDNTTKKLAL
ncbi:uncharacterized protein LOC135809331 [Sycon ciliatum]|uniref:uncharacterized protein LOC135809331 n=1 Tax=Sycon ciliatum TaxID=27933 RepID=UPI0031F6F311